MASSSTSSIHKIFKYDVFLSFRGTDTRKTFVDHLYHTLRDRGIRTYKDDEEIKQGKKISDELIRSIQDSKCYIIVFSKDYASSSWCLEELVTILECQKTNEHTAYPVFYDVEPTEVSHQSGEFGKIFAKHEKEEAAGVWREALREAAGVAGWELKNTFDGHEAKFIRKIIEVISLELRSISSSADEKLVGMETRVRDVVSLIETGVDDVRMIGIKGIGGGGKTTLARAVFDQISFQFEGKSFIENVRELSSASLSGLKSLQKQLISDVTNDQGISVSSVHDGKNMIKRRLHDIKVLVVLDDVDHREQLEALVGESNWFKPGSRIIITTRDEQLLVAHGVKTHDVQLLLDKEAICLFSRYAFGRGNPVQAYKELTAQVVHYAAGLPLTIRVLGSFLCGKNKDEWRDSLERLKRIPEIETLKILELSYIGLEKDYKEIFLDVACIMKDWMKDEAIEALESCGFYARIGLRVLEQKSLIKFDDSERVGMHDRIEEIGRDIVRRSHPDMPEKHNRLWNEDEIKNILANGLCTEETRCIKFSSWKINLESVFNGLRKMKKLRFLHMMPEWPHNYKSEINEVSPYFPDALRYLYWTEYPFKSLPKTFQANNVVSLVLNNSKIVQLWERGEEKVLSKLRFLDLGGSSLNSLDIGLTPNLEKLTLRYCDHLVELPDNIYMLKHLKYLNLDDCWSLDKLPKDLGRLESLEWLSLTFTKLKHLPDSICMLKHLQDLNLDRCSLLEKLPEDLGRLESLERLNLTLTELKHLPDSICMLKHLKSLKLDDCMLLEKLPEDLGLIECLESLHLSNTMIKHLPYSICMLKHMKTLNLYRCSFLEKLPEDLGRLECLEYLNLASTKIKHLLDSICMLKHMKSLQLGKCLLLEKLPEDIGQLECLPNLDLSYSKIRHLPDSICMLKWLKSLGLSHCSFFEKLPQDLGQLECLGYLNLSYTKIRHLPDSICMLKCLEDLDLSHCSFFEKLSQDLGRLECLGNLDLSYTKIRHLPDSICMLKCLEDLDLSHCSLLEKLPDNLGQLEFLGFLILSYTQIEHLPDSICMLKRLRSLKLKSCFLLEKLPEDLGKLETLWELTLSSTKIKHLPDSVCMLKHLTYLKLIDCSLLEKLPEDIGRLECLRKLIIMDCVLLRDIPNSICKMKSLSHLYLCYCIGVEKLPEELGHLKCLRELDIEGTCITHLPQSILLLKGLRIYGSIGILQSFGFTSEIQTLKREEFCYIEVLNNTGFHSRNIL